MVPTPLKKTLRCQAQPVARWPPFQAFLPQCVEGKQLIDQTKPSLWFLQYKTDSFTTPPTVRQSVIASEIERKQLGEFWPERERWKTSHKNKLDFKICFFNVKVHNFVETLEKYKLPCILFDARSKTQQDPNWN